MFDVSKVFELQYPAAERLGDFRLSLPFNYPSNYNTNDRFARINYRRYFVKSCKIIYITMNQYVINNQATVQWVVQKNLTNYNDFSALKETCQNLQIPFVGIDVIPFSNELPDFDRKPKSIFYGSTTFNNLAYSNSELKEGVFFDPTTFSVERYIKEWGEHMLNYGAVVTTIEELMYTDYDPEKMLFIRPDDDGKSFAGEVLKFGEYREWFERLKTIENSAISGKSRIVVGEPFHIGREWRLWCVGRKVIAASQYRNNFKLEKHRGCPNEVASFAEARCLQFTPHDVFVMDVCETGGELYIVECNCMNGAGFYNANIEAIVSNVTNYVSRL